jgi:organic radical activating enzyme
MSVPAFSTSGSAVSGLASSSNEPSLVEIFASIQGEGSEVGRSMVFVRFGGCDLRCRWCDSPNTWRASETCRIEEIACSGQFTERLNPISAEVIAEIVSGLAPRPATWISLTGGEPLLQPQAVAAVVDRLALAGRRIYLETHGLHSEALSSIVERVDLVSMDWKLASDVRWGPGRSAMPGQDFHDAHQAFLRVAMRAGEVYVKVVVTPSTQDEELDAMIDRIVSVSADIPLVLQPVTPMGGVDAMPRPEQLVRWQGRAEERLADVRLIPQTHPIYGVL